jgi:hypothetical protein
MQPFERSGPGSHPDSDIEGVTYCLGGRVGGRVDQFTRGSVPS